LRVRRSLSLRSQVVCGGVGCHADEKVVVPGFVTIEIGGRVVSPVQEAEQNQEGSAREQDAAHPTAVTHKLIGCRNRWPLTEAERDAAPESNQFGDACKKDEQSAEIGEDAGPPDCFERTPCESNIRNQEHTDWKKSRAKKKQCCQQFLPLLSERYEWLQQREQECEVAKTNHVRVGIHFGAAVFEMAADFRER